MKIMMSRAAVELDSGIGVTDRDSEENSWRGFVHFFGSLSIPLSGGELSNIENPVVNPKIVR